MQDQTARAISGVTGADAAQNPNPATQRHLFHVFASFGLGGVPIRIANIANHFGDRYRHSFVAVDACYDGERRLAANVPADFPLRDRQTRGLPGALFDIWRVLDHERPDLLLTYNWGAIDWALANRLRRSCRHVHFESGFGPEEVDRQLPRRVWFRRLALGGRSPVVVPSHTLRSIATEVWRLDPERVLYVPNGVDCARFDIPRDGTLRRTLVPTADTPIVGTLAPLRAEKNLGRLLRAFGQLRDGPRAQLVIFGDGAERPRLEAEAQTLGIADRVTFAGHTDAIEAALACFDVFVLSSDTEQMPNALIQAMAAGLPVAGVDVGDVKHLVAAENRPFIVARDAEAELAAAIGHFLDNRATRVEIGACNRRHVAAHYGMDRMQQAYEAIFEG